MCFSPEASFSVAALCAAAGGVCLLRMKHHAFAGLAIMPFIFSLQQAVEGLIWLRPAWPDPAFLATIFIIIAKIVWPVFVPLAVLASEAGPRRRKALLRLSLAGILLAILFLLDVTVSEHLPVPEAGRISYPASFRPCAPDFLRNLSEMHILGFSSRDLILVPYALVIIASLLLSGHWQVRLVGFVIAAGLCVSLLSYRSALVSVWCFFAAVASLLLVAAAGRIRVTEAESGTE